MYKYLNILLNINTYNKKLKLEKLFLINFKNKQVKLNILDLIGNKKYIFSIGLILKVLNLYKKSNRKNLLFLKYLINYVINKINIKNKKIVFVIKGLIKNYVKMLYYFKLIVINFNISIFYINPVKIFKLINLKKKRSIKRRLYKKIVDFNKI